MFLSVIISCHNCKPYIKKLLTSIVIQNFDDVEVIISDDNSTDGFMEEVNKFNALLNIKYFKTDKHKIHCPGNTRRDGLRHATGEWVTFIDHDDYFAPEAFKIVYGAIQSLTPEQQSASFVFSKIAQVTTEGQYINTLDAPTWLHGNFYKRSFLLENDINFKEDHFGNEDLYFNNQVYTYLEALNIPRIDIDASLYNWVANTESLSNTAIQGTDCTYTEKYFKDYIYSNSEPMFMIYQKIPKMRDSALKKLIDALLLGYFYYERAIYLYKDSEIITEMLQSIKELYSKIINVFGVSKQYIIDTLYTDPNQVLGVKTLISQLSGNFIEKHSINEFINNLV